MEQRSVQRSFHLASLSPRPPFASSPVPAPASFPSAASVPPGSINSQLIAEWHFSSSATYTTAAPPQWMWSDAADGGGAVAARRARGGTAMSMARATARPPSHRPPQTSIEAKKLLHTIRYDKEGTTN